MKREIIVSSFWLIFSFYVSFESYRLGLSTANRPGPGFFPFIAAVGIGLIAASRLINSLRVSAPDDHSTLGIAGEAGLVLGVIAGMMAYAFLLDFLGFLLCTFLLVAFYLRLIAARRWTRGSDLRGCSGARVASLFRRVAESRIAARLA